MKNSRTPRLSDLIRQPPEPPPPPRTSVAPAPAPEPEPTELAAAPEPPASPEPAAAAPKDLPIIQPTPPETEARRDYHLLQGWLLDVIEQARSGALQCTDIFEDVRAILERPNLLEALFAETFKSRSTDAFLARKLLNVGIYALRLGRAMGLEGEALVSLGAAGLLHRIGFARLPSEVVNRPGALSRGEMAKVREHPVIGRDLIAALGEEFTPVAEIVYSVSERIDGSGYPRGLSGDQIPIESLIIGLVDVFEALIQPRPYRDRVVPFRASKEIIEQERARFPRTLLREFIASFSVFPPFTYVRLNSKAIARVIETEPGYPLRPQVTIVIDAHGRRPAQPQTVRLKESPLLYITAPVDETELATAS